MYKSEMAKYEVVEEDTVNAQTRGLKVKTERSG
jgi:hypothetical protein